MLSRLPRNSRDRSASERTHRAAVRPDGYDRPAYVAVPSMLTGRDAAVSKARRSLKHGARAAALARWGLSLATGACLLAALELLARLHGNAPSHPPPADTRTLALVRLSAPAAKPAPVAVARPPAEPPQPAAPPPPSRPAAAPEPLPAVVPDADPLPEAALAAAPQAPQTARAPERAVAEPEPAPSAPPQAAPATPMAPPGDVPRKTAQAPAPASQAVSPRLVSVRALDPGFRPLSPLRPRYPDVARRLGRPGAVDVEVEVAPDGSIAGVDVRERTPGWGFGVAAREAVAQVRFTPPRVGGEPVRVRWRKTLRFQP